MNQAPRPGRRLARSAVAVAALVGLAIAIGTPRPVGAQPAPDPREAEQWALEATRLREAWSRTTGDGIVVAVVDTGVDLDHPDLAGALVDGVDLVDGDGRPDDPHGHGTHVAGVVAARAGNGVGGAGGAPGARIMPVRALDASGEGSNDTIAEGITWAVDHGASVVNLSLGEAGIASRLSRGGPLNRAITEAAERGAVVVAASGNEGRRDAAYRARVPVIVVGAVDRDGQPAPFSNFGDRHAVAAPGVDVLSTVPTGPTTLFPEGSDGYAALDGTSMATPYVSALASLLLSQGRTPDDVREVVAATAANPEGDARLGAGVIDAMAATSSPPGELSSPPAGDDDAAPLESPAQADEPRRWVLVAGAGALVVVAAALAAWAR